MSGIEMLLNSGSMMYPRKHTKVERKVVFSPPPGANTERMHQHYVDVLHSLEPVVRIPKAAMERVVTLREKLAHVSDTIAKRAKVGFRELLQDAGNRGEVVVTFLAVLELVKQRTVSVHQDSVGSDMRIERVD
jgi:chromatin segregation and condensation protein Rec8/ScpA/Scc1 (kleisin family)